MEKWYWLSFTLQINGLLQSLVAVYSFKFLSKNDDKQGYFSDKRTITYPFLLENAFFVLQTLFGTAYNNPILTVWLRNTYVIELLFIFLPFQTIRKFFPKTSFRDSLNNDLEKSDQNVLFMYNSTLITKTFYMFGKHIMGFFVSYLAFFDLLTPYHKYLFHMLTLGGGYNLTIGIFLHTLKFKKYIGPRTAMILYIGGFAISGIPLVIMLFQVYHHYILLAIAIGGWIANFQTPNIFATYQFLAAIGCYAYKFGYLEQLIKT
jgi:hypothetical protein